MIVELVFNESVSSPGYVSVLSASEIINAWEAGKLIRFHFQEVEGANYKPELYMDMTGYEPAWETSDPTSVGDDFIFPLASSSGNIFNGGGATGLMQMIYDRSIDGNGKLLVSTPVPD